MSLGTTQGPPRQRGVTGCGCWRVWVLGLLHPQCSGLGPGSLQLGLGTHVGAHTPGATLPKRAPRTHSPLVSGQRGLGAHRQLCLFKSSSPQACHTECGLCIVTLACTPTPGPEARSQESQRDISLWGQGPAEAHGISKSKPEARKREQHTETKQAHGDPRTRIVPMTCLNFSKRKTS